MATSIEALENEREGLSRRRILVGTAWVTPAVLVGLAAPPAAASVQVEEPTVNPLQGTQLIVLSSSGQTDEIQASVSLPAGLTLNTVTVLVTWTKSTQNGPNPYVEIPVWNSPQLNTGTDAFTRSTLSSGEIFVIKFFKAAPNSPYTVTISGTTSTGQAASRSFSGTLV
jgi:hypothetical protein